MFLEKKEIYDSMKIGVVGVSDWIVSEAKKSILRDSLFIKRIYNWIDTTRFKPIENNMFSARYNITQDENIILAVSQGWYDNKGLTDLIEVAKRFAYCRVVLVGKPPKCKSLPENMLLIPFISDLDKLVEAYSAADIFVNPSRMETFGKVTAEAMACGTPIVVYENTGNKELVVPGVGEIAENLNIDDFCKKIKVVLDNGKDFYKISCVRVASERFEMNNQLKEYAKSYRQLIELGK